VLCYFFYLVYLFLLKLTHPVLLTGTIRFLYANYKIIISKFEVPVYVDSYYEFQKKPMLPVLFPFHKLAGAIWAMGMPLPTTQRKKAKR
jgi:hypothetical protein